MPKSKRSKVVHLTQVNKKTREDKEELFNKIRAYIVEFAHCFVFSVNNMRNNHLKDVRREMQDSRYIIKAGYYSLFVLSRFCERISQLIHSRLANTCIFSSPRIGFVLVKPSSWPARWATHRKMSPHLTLLNCPHSLRALSA